MPSALAQAVFQWRPYCEKVRSHSTRKTFEAEGGFGMATFILSHVSHCKSASVSLSTGVINRPNAHDAKAANPAKGRARFGEADAVSKLTSLGLVRRAVNSGCRLTADVSASHVVAFARHRPKAVVG